MALTPCVRFTIKSHTMIDKVGILRARQCHCRGRRTRTAARKDARGKPTAGTIVCRRRRTSERGNGDVLCIQACLCCAPVRPCCSSEVSSSSRCHVGERLGLCRSSGSRSVVTSAKRNTSWPLMQGLAWPCEALRETVILARQSCIDIMTSNGDLAGERVCPRV